MMTLRLLAVLLLLTFCLPLPASATPKALPLEKGFQDIPWGAEVAQFPSLEKIGVKHMAEFYVDRSKAYAVAGVAVPRVVFGATNGQIFAVYVELPSQEAFDTVRSNLEKQLGAEKSRQDGPTTVWSWRKGPVRVKLKLEPVSGEGQRKLALYYEPLAKDVELSIFEKDGDETHRGPTLWYSVKDNSLPTAIPLLRF